MIVEHNRHKRFFTDLNSLVLFYSFELETWDVDHTQRFVYATTISFFLLSMKTIEHGANFYKEIESRECFRGKYIKRISAWYTQSKRFDLDIDPISYYETLGFFARDAYDMGPFINFQIDFV